MKKRIGIKADYAKTEFIEVDQDSNIANLQDMLHSNKKWKRFSIYYQNHKLSTQTKIKDLNLKDSNLLNIKFLLLGGQKIKIIIVTIHNEQRQINVQNTMTGYQLKEYIFTQISQSLGVNEMKLSYAGVLIENDKQLSHYKIVEKNGTLKILQTKVDLNQIPGLVIAYNSDPIGEEQQAARMPCGHVIGQIYMTVFMRSLISARKYDIKCPSKKPDGTDCQGKWEYEMCRKVGTFTKEEMEEFQIGLSKNWILQFATQCPQCKFNVIKGGLQSNRVVCPNCGYGDFCYICLKKWIKTGYDLCGNQQCRYIYDFVKNCTWDRKFKLKENGQTKQYLLPRYRFCPTCQAPIEHKEACKHMECKKCGTGFCWICLAISVNKNYPCGSFNNYCGKVAQTQQINL